MKPDVITYNALMDCYGLIGQLDKAVKVFELMLSNEHTPDAISYTILIDNYFENGRSDLALRLFHEMDHKGLKHTTVTYNASLAGLCQTGRVDDAKMLHKRMIDAGATPDIDTYHIILDGLSKNMFVDETVSLFQETSLQHGRNIKIFTILIYGFFRVCRTKEARDLFNTLFGEGFIPDVVTYTIMLKGLERERMFDEFDGLFSSLEKYGCSSGSTMVNVIVRSLLKKGGIKKAMEFLKRHLLLHFC